MALFKCPECGREISDKASACPHCGCPVTTVLYQDMNTITDKSLTNPQNSEAVPPPTKNENRKTNRKNGF